MERGGRQKGELHTDFTSAPLTCSLGWHCTQASFVFQALRAIAHGLNFPFSVHSVQKGQDGSMMPMVLLAWHVLDCESWTSWPWLNFECICGSHS